MQKIKVFLVENLLVKRSEFRTYIHQNENLEFAGESASVIAAIKELRNTHADILIIDINLLFTDGFEITKILIKENPYLNIILRSNPEENEKATQVLGNVARSIINKISDAKSFYEAIETVYRGGKYFDRGDKNGKN